MDEKPKKHHRAYLRRIDRRSLVLFPTTEHAQNQEPEIKKKEEKKEKMPQISITISLTVLFTNKEYIKWRE